MLTGKLVLLAIMLNPVANFYCAYKCFKGINYGRVFGEEITRIILGCMFSISGLVSSYVLLVSILYKLGIYV